MATVNISGKTSKAEAWCVLHIDQRRYHISYRAGWKVGGNGWKIRYGQEGAILDIEDEQLATLLLLSI
jgi:hypothetical protein